MEENKPISGNLLEKEDGVNAHFYRQKGNSIKGLISWNEDLKIAGKIRREDSPDIDGFYVPINFGDFNKVYFKKWLYIIFVTDMFWENVFPLILASGALISIVIEIETRYNLLAFCN